MPALTPLRAMSRKVFGPQSIGAEEYFDLDRQPVGLQFWRSMMGNPQGGPAKYMRFGGYVRYGFSIWEEQQMIKFGLWSRDAIEDMWDVIGDGFISSALRLSTAISRKNDVLKMKIRNKISGPAVRLSLPAKQMATIACREQ